jgi:tyrosyl-tRNA synthetase
MAFKQGLARRLVERFHGADAAAAAEAHFFRVVRRREAPADLPEQRVEAGEDGRRGLLETLEALGLVASRSEARRLLGQGAIQVDGNPVADPTLRLDPGSHLLKVGKRRFARIHVG